jgi:uncharacterized phage-like protein YoqJ
MIPANEYAEIQNRLNAELVELVRQGVQYFCTGGALGFDTIAALTILKLKQTFSHIHLILVLPCKDQTNGWSEKDKRIYNQIRDEADKITYTSEFYHKGCMHRRNRHLVDNSGICVCYLKQSIGGTAYTADYACKKKLHIINIAQQ